MDLLFCEAFDCAVRAGIKATYFELMITAALLAFRVTGVEVAIIEVGMGGRWDATNALDPLLTVPGQCGFGSQQKSPGPTREVIGREKLWHGASGPTAGIGTHAGSHLGLVPLECRPELHPATRPSGGRDLVGPQPYPGWRVGLPGAHQLENLATALESCVSFATLVFRGTGGTSPGGHCPHQLAGPSVAHSCAAKMSGWMVPTIPTVPTF
ncbi:MAG: hypothetical protein IPN59_08430 [Holophaga sp.]|nr:hypothetical protein [Holophaga sp.]